MSDLPGRARYELANACSFKVSHYEEVLRRAKALGYRLTSFADYDADAGKTMLLRHDLDNRIAVERTPHFARIETELGASATYFVRVHAPDYHPFDYRTYVTLGRLLAMGHEIGLHYEAVDMAAVSGETELALFEKEKQVLEAVLGVEIKTSSQHGDYSAYSHPDYHQFFDRHSKAQARISADASEKRFREDMKYLSDSNCIWPEGCVCKHIGDWPMMHVLTHPDHWFEEHYHTW